METGRLNYGAWYVSQMLDALTANPEVWSKMARSALLFATVQDYVGQLGEQRLGCFVCIVSCFAYHATLAGRDLRTIFSIYQHLQPFVKISTCR